MKFMIEIGDRGMTGKLNEGDVALARSGFNIENGDIALALVTDDAAKSSRVYIRKAVIEQNKITLHPTASEFPVMTFEGAELDNIAFLGKVYGFIRDTDKTQKEWPVTARKGR